MRKLLAIAVVCGVASAAFGAWGDTSGRILPDRDWGNRNGDGALVNAGWAQSCRIWKWRAQEVAVYDWNDAGRTAILDFMTNNPLPDPADGRYVFRLDLTTSGGFLETPRFDNVDSTGASTRFTCRTLNIMEDSMDWSEGDGWKRPRTVSKVFRKNGAFTLDVAGPKYPRMESVMLSVAP